MWNCNMKYAHTGYVLDRQDEYSSKLWYIDTAMVLLKKGEW